VPVVLYAMFALACMGGSSGTSVVGGDGASLPNVASVDLDKANNPPPGGGNQAAPGADSGVVAPHFDPYQIALRLSCIQSSCGTVNIPNLPSDNTEDEGCTQTWYKFFGSIYPENDGVIIRMVNNETQKFSDYKTSEINGMHGSFSAKVILDTTPDISFYKAPDGYVSPYLGMAAMTSCGGPCDLSDWIPIILKPADDSCDFLKPAFPAIHVHLPK